MRMRFPLDQPDDENNRVREIGGVVIFAST